MKNFATYFLFAVLLSGLFAVNNVYSQSEDSLLQKVGNIDVNLDAPPDSVENLYLNAVSFQSFYDILSPVGEWIQISKEEVDEDMGDGNGQSFSSISGDESLVFIWRPSGAGADWRPYTNGSWVYTDRGWFWNSNEGWGWAVYHYGRWWHSAKLGWVWMPGYVWAPAWVTWRVADNHIGWCALSPRAKWRMDAGITEFNYRYKYNDADWVFVNKANFANDINGANITAVSENRNLVSGSKSLLNMREQNEAVTLAGPDANDIEKTTGMPVNEKSLKYVNDKSLAGVGDDKVSVYNEPLKRYKSRDDKLKAENIEHPLKYKRTERVKKIIKRRVRHRIKIRKRS